MANKGIITQAEFQELQFRLGVMASSLSFHANDDVSNAHGINIVVTPATDDDGNPTDKYYDQYGNTVGPYHVGFIINDTQYYAPGKVTSLEGSTPTTGITEVDDGQYRGAGDSAWITQFTTPLTQDINLLIENQLLPHTLLGHWETHGGMTLVPENIYNEDNILVAENTIRIPINGIVYKIPVSIRKGGPKQAWRDFRFSVVGSSPFYHNVVSRSRDDDQTVRFYYADGRGTLPRQVLLQVNNNYNGTSALWHTFGTSGGNFTPTGGQLHTVFANNITYPSTGPIQYFVVRSYVGVDDSRLVGTFRVKITADYGGDNIVRYSRWLQFYGNDEDGGWYSGPDSKVRYYYNAGLPGATEYGSLVY